MGIPNPLTCDLFLGHPGDMAATLELLNEILSLGGGVTVSSSYGLGLKEMAALARMSKCRLVITDAIRLAPDLLKEIARAGAGFVHFEGLG